MICSAFPTNENKESNKKSKVIKIIWIFFAVNGKLQTPLRSSIWHYIKPFKFLNPYRKEINIIFWIRITSAPNCKRYGVIFYLLCCGFDLDFFESAWRFNYGIIRRCVKQWHWYSKSVFHCHNCKSIFSSATKDVDVHTIKICKKKWAAFANPFLS